MNKYFIQLFLKENTVILPGFGALTLLNERLSEIVFLPDLKTDDGKLASYISEIEGIEEQDAQNTIAKFIREIESNLNKGDSFDIFEFGSFTKNENGQIEFSSWMKDKVAEPKEDPKPGIKTAILEKPKLTFEEEVVLTEPEVVLEIPIKDEVVIETPQTVREEEKSSTKEMDSLSLIRALLNDDEFETKPTAYIKTETEKKNDKSQEKFIPVVKTSVTQEAEDPQKKKKRKFPFWFFFILLGMLLFAILICYNFDSIKNKFQSLATEETVKKDIFFVDSIKTDNPDLKKKVSSKEKSLKESINLDSSKKPQSTPEKINSTAVSDNKKNMSEINKDVTPSPKIVSPKEKPPKETSTNSIQESNHSDQNVANGRGDFHIISGVYGPKRLAQKRVDSFKAEGLNARILPKKIGGLYHVSMITYPTKPPAIVFLRSQRLKGRRVWLLTYRL